MLILSALLALQAPKVQTFAARRAIALVKDKIDGTVTIDRVHLRPFSAVVLHNVTITDNNPFKAEADTFCHADVISATVAFSSFFDGGGVRIGKARVQGGMMLLTVEPTGDSTTVTNLERIFRMSSSKDTVKTEPSQTQYFEIDKVEIDGFRYKMRLYDNEMDIPSDAINWSDLDIYDINIRGRKLGMKGIVMYGIADELSFKEKSGYVANHLSGETRVGEGKTIIKDLRIRDMWSDVHMEEFRMSYENTASFSDFIEAVRIDARILPSRLSMRTIGYFAPQVKFMTAIAELTGEFHGPVNDFSLDNLRVKALDSGLSATLNGRMTGIPGFMAIDAKLSDATFTATQLGDFLSSISPSSIDFRGTGITQTFRADATAKGPLDRLAVNVAASCPSGRLRSSLDIRNVISDRDIVISGNVATDNLDVGRLMGISALGKVTADAALRLSLPSSGIEVSVDSLRSSHLEALGYPFTGLRAKGRYGSDGFGLRLRSNDPSLAMTLAADSEGDHYSLTSDIRYLDLHAIGLDSREASRLCAAVDGEFDIPSADFIHGKLSIKDFLLEDGTGIYDPGDVKVYAVKTPGDNSLTLDSEFADARFSGTGFIDEFIRDIKKATVERELPALGGTQDEPYSGNEYTISLATRKTRDILPFFSSDAYIAENTTFDLRLAPDAAMTARLSSPRLASADNYLKDIDLRFDNLGSALCGDVKVKEIAAGPLLLNAVRGTLDVNDEKIDLGLTYDNDTDLRNEGKLRLSALLGRDGRDSLTVAGYVLPSYIYFNSDRWDISGDGATWDGDRFRLSNLDISSQDQSIRLDGGYSARQKDTLTLSLDNFNLSMVNNLMSRNLDIRGIANGRATLTSPASEGPGILLNVKIDSASVAGDRFGTLYAKSVWDEQQDGFSIFLANDLDGKENIRAEGLYIPEGQSLKLHSDLDGMSVAFAQPFLEGIFSQMEGTVSGGEDLGGSLDNIDISSRDLRIDDAILRVDYTNVAYNVSGPVHLDNGGAWFDDVSIADRFDGKGTISGSIPWNHFKDIGLDVHLKFRGMEVVQLAEGANDLFYGNVFGTGGVDITGPLSTIDLSVDAATTKTGDFHLPLSGASVMSTSNLLTFTKPIVPVERDAYEEARIKAREEGGGSTDLSIKLRLNVNQDTEAFIEVDKETGNILTGRGNGLIEIEVNPSKDVFQINGNYNILSGKYHLDVLNIAQKDFHIQDGSSIKFGGELMDSELDIRALYKLKASIGPLISDSTSTSRRNVECGMHITDKLSGPRVDFSINVPDLDPTTQVRVAEVLESKDRVQKQFLSLLIAGSFLPEESSGIVDNTSMLNTTVSEIMSGQLNNIMQKLDLPIDFGLGYQTNSAGNSMYDVAISTQLFNNRVIVNGTLGNRVYSSGETSTGEFVGDLDIEIKLDRRGALRLNLFSHSADQYSSFLDNSQRNGVGLTYQREFDTFKGLMRSLFAGRRRRQEAESIRQQAIMNEEKIRIHIEEDE